METWISRSIAENQRLTAALRIDTSDTVHSKYPRSNNDNLPLTPPKTPPHGSAAWRRSKTFNVRGTEAVDFSKPLDTSIVQGKTALVVDGASGLGFGIAAALAENGCKVALCGDNEEAGEAAIEGLQGKGCDVRFFKTEGASWESQAEAFRQTLQWSDNQLDIVVTSPGIVTNNLLMSILPKHHSPDFKPAKPPTKTLEVSLLGVYYTTSLALFYFNLLQSQRRDPSFRPQLVFICSMAGYDGLDFGSDYAAAKHGVRAIWKTTRKPRPSMAPYQSNLLAPTYIRQDKIERTEEENKNHQNQTNEIADVVAGALRCIMDPDVEGRAVCCCQGSRGAPGNLNFDLCDDIVDCNGGQKLLDNSDDIWLPSSANLSEDSNCAVQ